MSQETILREAVDDLRARGSRYAREAYVFVVAALSETARGLPAERRDDKTRRHLSGQELTAGVIRIAREEFGPALAPMVFREWGVHSTEDIGEIVFELVEVEQLTARPEDTIADFRDHGDLFAALAEPLAQVRPQGRDA